MTEFEKFMQLYGLKREELTTSTKALIKEYNLRKKYIKDDDKKELDDSIMEHLIKFTNHLSAEDYKTEKNKPPLSEKEKADAIAKSKADADKVKADKEAQAEGYVDAEDKAKKLQAKADEEKAIADKKKADAEAKAEGYVDADDKAKKLKQKGIDDETAKAQKVKDDALAQTEGYVDAEDKAKKLQAIKDYNEGVAKAKKKSRRTLWDIWFK